MIFFFFFAIRSNHCLRRNVVWIRMCNSNTPMKSSISFLITRLARPHIGVLICRREKPIIVEFVFVYLHTWKYHPVNLTNSRFYLLPRFKVFQHKYIFTSRVNLICGCVIQVNSVVRRTAKRTKKILLPEWSSGDVKPRSVSIAKIVLGKSICVLAKFLSPLLW